MKQHMTNPVATIRTSRLGDIEIELFPEMAPQSVRSFIDLANAGYFDGLAFWRIEKGWLIQTGCPRNDGLGSPGYCIKGEFAENGVPNALKFTRGTVGLGRLLPDGGGSHFFILVADEPALDGKYAAFGRVTAGLEVADAIADGPATQDGFLHRALEQEFIKTVRVATFGIAYPPPEKLPAPSLETQLAELDPSARPSGWNQKHGE